ncbi:MULTISPECIES: hypothetical protein [unclassified Lentimonas]|uniref:hypothetical protein n=1 Tax=unclassified Lentimonas TaxID=2630993 RepID=UPI0013250337|nr:MULTISPECIES: hypothetical protein [unclassified Lentimonas]CAA6693624.1 Unannotated [Lentimonas sp. CC10]CAA6697718.1 Unannotated [Lentimonas sp. CC19]CAA7072474.1 Unannotated [Lentimonas sp. CC11]
MRPIAYLILATLLITVGCSKQYTATATIDLDHDKWKAKTTTDTELHSHGCCFSDPIAPAINTVRSDSVREMVSQRLVIENDLSIRPLELERHLQVTHMDDSLKIQIHYTDPDPKLAAWIANTFAEAYIDYTRNLNLDASIKAVEDLRMRADQQKHRVEALETEIANAREASENGILGKLLREHDVQKGFYEALMQRMDQEQAQIESPQTSYKRILQRAPL